jgi:membrane protein implicated in regulation of membrane protease activity
MGKVRYWYDDAPAEAWFGAGFLAFVFGLSCAFVSAACVPIVGYAALVTFVALTVPLIYLIVTFRRRPEVPSAEPGDGAKIK